MSKKNIYKLIGLNLGIIIIDSTTLICMTRFATDSLIVFSLQVTLLIMSVLVFFYFNYCILFEKPMIKLFGTNEVIEDDDYIDALEDCLVKKVFETSVKTTKEQIQRINNKETSLDTILSQYFQKGEMTYIKFDTVIDNTKALFFDNVKKIINRITIFDTIEYSKLTQKFGNDLDKYTNIDPKAKIYQEHIDYVKNLVERNEDILTKFDALLLEISKLDDVDNETFEQLQAIEDINNPKLFMKYQNQQIISIS